MGPVVVVEVLPVLELVVEHLGVVDDYAVQEMGVEAFAERARRELLATGETARRAQLDQVLAPDPATTRPR
jgi:hypothetical protein